MSKLSLLPGMVAESNENYHENTDWLSHSLLDEFIESIPLFAGRYVTKTIEKRKETAALVVGSAFHTLVLEPDTAEGLYAVAPKCNKATKDGKAIYAGFLEKNAGKKIIDQDPWDTVRRMADSVHGHSLASAVLATPGWPEQSCYAKVPEDADPEIFSMTPPGQYKARFDKLFEEGHIADLKSTRHMNFHMIAKDFHTLGYHRQSAFYEMVRDALMGAGTSKSEFWYVVTCNVEPFETFVFDLHPAAKLLGRSQNRTAIWELNERRKLNDWSGREKNLRVLNLPGYAYRDAN